MKKHFLLCAMLFLLGVSSNVGAQTTKSPTEGVITRTPVGEQRLMKESLQMLADFSEYMKSIYTDAGSNSEGKSMGYFKARSAGQNNEDGVRTNLDLSMICSFLLKYGKTAEVHLPDGVTWNDIRHMALRSLTWGFSTHRSTMLSPTTNGQYWGSAVTNADGTKGGYTWESSLWTESLAFSAWMLDELNLLTTHEKDCIETVITAEANHELTRDIPVQMEGDTKAEENGWETNVLSVALALYPDNANASQWYDKLKRFAINCYTTRADMQSEKIVDGRPAKEWIVGANLYDDYTLQNHNYFHTSYQNVVVQELSESILALTMMQKGSKWKTPDALRWGQKEEFDAVLKQLALADGELAMPNGNDWSMFLYDQLPAYSAMACLFADRDALMLEDLAFKYTKARQQTTSDGSWMLNSDIGPRRMGVTAHRVMMTYLFHHYFPTGNAQPSTWDDFQRRHSAAKAFPCQNIVRAMTPDRFTCFSWSKGLRSTTGMIATNSVDKNKILIPYKAEGTGNFLGHYMVEGKRRAVNEQDGRYSLYGDAFLANGSVKAAGEKLSQHFALYSSPGNAVVLLDCVKPLEKSVTIEKEEGGLMAVSTDPFTCNERTLYYADGEKTTNGEGFFEFGSDWVNIDNEIGIVSKRPNNRMTFGGRRLINSIYTSLIVPCYSQQKHELSDNSFANYRHVVYYSGINHETTRNLSSKIQILNEAGLEPGWSGAVVPDPDGTNYLVLVNFDSDNQVCANIRCQYGAPVFNVPTEIEHGYSRGIFTAARDSSVANVLKVFVERATAPVKAIQLPNSTEKVRLISATSQVVSLKAIGRKGVVSGKINLKSGVAVEVSLRDGVFFSEKRKTFLP